MSGAPGAAVVIVGTELLLEGRMDTNGPWISGALADEGYEPVLRLTVPDDRAAIAEALRIAVRAAPLIVVSGGLGPTFDDLTREAAADAFGLRLGRSAALVESIRSRYRSRGLTPPEAAMRMADLLEGAEILPNSTGTAPGQFIAGPPAVALLPGVPAEIEAMIRDELRPRIRGRSGSAAPLRRVFKVAGLYESEVESRIGGLIAQEGTNQATILAAPGEITLILRARPGGEGAIAMLADQIRSKLGDAVYAEEDVGIEMAVGQLLARAGWRLATAESCTGGMLGGLLTRVPGSSRYYAGGVVCYSNEAKVDLLGIPGQLLESAGAVSEEAARAMASAARAQVGADLALAITGIAGPGGGSAGKPVGLVWIGLAAPWGETARHLQLSGSRSLIREISCRAALDLLRREIASRGRETP